MGKDVNDGVLGPWGSGALGGSLLLRDALAACDMPREGLLRWIEHNENFCNRHGSDVYREWLALYAECREVLDAP